jgi:hypothetical protein
MLCGTVAAQLYVGLLLLKLVWDLLLFGILWATMK